MKAAAIERFSPPSVLELHKLPIPQPGPDEILIALTAAGVGVWDAGVRDGAWQPPASRSFLSSWARTGREWSRPRERGCVFRRGRSSLAYRYTNPNGGFYAEYVAAKARDAGRVPKHLDLLQVGAALTTGLTALQGIDDQLRLRSSDTLLV